MCGILLKDSVFRALWLATQTRDNKQLLDEVEQNIVICQWRADQLFADAEGRGK